MNDNEEILQRVHDAANGNSQSLAMLFQLYRPYLYVQALRIVGNTPLAQDALQDTFISAYTHISQLRCASMFYPWIKKILVNNCYLALRKEMSNRKAFKASMADTFIEESIEQRLDSSAGNRQVYGSLSYLSPELRSCVLLRYFSSFDRYEEIAEVLGIPVGTVRSRLAAARQKLCAIYSHYNDDDEQAFTEAQQWSTYYRQIWDNFYEEPKARHEFFKNLNADLHVRFTSGKSARGKYLLEEEFNNDLIYGSRFNLQEVHSCGNISILEGLNTNSPEYPDRCAPSSIIVLFRKKDNRVNACNVFDSPRNR